jgi:hypothetical protein
MAAQGLVEIVRERSADGTDGGLIDRLSFKRLR